MPRISTLQFLICVAAFEHLNHVHVSTERAMFCAFGLGLQILFYKITQNHRTVDIQILLLAGGLRKFSLLCMEMY
jgi:hypothetical protein